MMRTRSVMIAIYAMAIAMTIFGVLHHMPSSAVADCSTARAAHDYDIGLIVRSVSPSITNAVNLAITKINAAAMLGDDRLVLAHTITTPSTCDPIQATTYANDMIAQGVQVVIGPSCSSEIKVTAPLLAAAGIPQVTVDATSPSLFNQADYPLTLMMAANDNIQAQAIIAIINKYGWQRVAVLGTTDTYGSEGAASVVSLIRNSTALNSTIGVAYPAAVTTNGTVAEWLVTFRQLKAANYRCFVMFMQLHDAAIALEAAYQLGMTGSPYVWIFTDAIGGDSVDSLFTNDHTMAAANGALLLQQANIYTTFTAQKFVKEYTTANSGATPAGQAAYAYDAVYAIAYGIAAAKAQCNNVIVTGASLVSNITSQTFNGASTGVVKFVGNHQVNWNYRLLNAQGLDPYVSVGTVDGNVTLSVVQPIIWPGGSVVAPTLRRYRVAVMSDFSLPYGPWFVNSVRLAIAQLNDVDVPILGGDNLELPDDMIMDEECDSTVAASAMKSLISRSPRPVAVIGPYCSAAGLGAFPLAAAAHLPVINPGATSLLFTNRTDYPYHNRVQQSLAPDVQNILRVVRYFKWNRIAIIGTNDPFSGGGADRLHALAQSIAITSVVTKRWKYGSGIDVIMPILKRLQDADVRAIVTHVHPDTFVLIMKAAMALGYYGPGIVWISGANEAWLGFDDPSIAPAVNGALILQYTPINTTAINKYFGDYRNAAFTQEPSPSLYGAYAYDAALLLAQSIANTKATGALPSTGSALQNAIATTRVAVSTGDLYAPTLVNADGTPVPTDVAERMGERAYYTIYNAVNGTLVPCATMNRTDTIDEALFGDLDDLRLIRLPIWADGTTKWPVSTPPGTFITNATIDGITATCDAGTYAGPNTIGSCITCDPNDYCPFAASARFPAASIAAQALRQPPPSGPIASSNAVAELFKIYGILIAVLVFVLFVAGIIFADRLKNVLKPLDLIYHLHHPTEMGKAPIRRQTALGGLFFVLSVICGIIVFAFLLTRFFVDRYIMNQTVVPGLSDVSGNMDISFVANLIGVDEWRLCDNACEVSSATIPGTFTCVTDIPVDSHSCIITFTPTFSSLQFPVVDDEFSISFVAPSVTALAIQWSVTSIFSAGHDYGVSGTIVPPMPDDEVFFGSGESSIGILLRPAILERAKNLFDDSVQDTLYGYLSYLGNPVIVGETINATTYFTPQDMSMTPGIGDGIVYGPRPGVSITMTAIRDSSVTRFIIDEKDPSGVLLIASLSSFIGGIFALLTTLLGIVEGCFIKSKRKKQQSTRNLHDGVEAEMAEPSTLASPSQTQATAASPTPA